MDIISRVNVGTLALGFHAIPALQCYTTIGALYSRRRLVGPIADPEKQVPILSFSTQQAPILAAAANAYVLQAFAHWAMAEFCNARDQRVRAGIAAVFKSVALQLSQRSVIDVSERCGAQGLFSHNQFVTLYVSELNTPPP